MSVTRILLAAAAIALTTTAARADTRRIAVLVGHNAGGDGQPALRWAEDDASKLADVLIQLGDVSPADLFLVQGKGAAQVKEAIAGATHAVHDARQAPDDRVVVYFYYSGHSDGTAIELGRERLSFDELKAMLAGTGADVRVMIVDACKSGTLVAKGGRPGPAFSVDLVDDLGARGEAMLTSSAADEQSLESSEVRGSFFTHHLVSGLRGAADSSGDGRVTLAEAYQYAFDKTVAASAATGQAPQHPSYDYRLSGRGELILTAVAQRSASLELPAGFDRALITAVQRDQVIAELAGNGTRRVSVAAGTYAVRLWRQGTVVAGRVAVADGASVGVRWDDLRPLDGSRTLAKGALDGDLSPAAQAEYDEHALSVGDPVASVDGSPPTRKGSSVYLGRYRTEIDPDDFFHLVGREDLADAYATRHLIKAGLLWGGLAAAAGGVIFASTRGGCDTAIGTDPNHALDSIACVQHQADQARIGWAIAVVGGVAALGSLAVSTDVAREGDMRRMADQYNTVMRIRLHAGVHVGVAPTAGPNGGGAMISGSF